MLLKLLYDFAHSRRLLDDLAFAPKAIRWVIPLNADGNLIGAGPLETTGQKNRGKEYPSPQTSRSKNAGGIAEFLADNITGLFNLDPDPEKDKDNERKRKERNDNNAAKFEDFWRQIKTAFNETQHPALKVLMQFHGRTKDSPPFLRWGESKEPKPNEKPNWWLTTASGDEVRLGHDNFTFKVDGELLLNDEAKLRPFWRKVYQKEIDDENTSAKRGIVAVYPPSICRAPSAELAIGTKIEYIELQRLTSC
jgi:CRISPR-associated protein Csd1